MPDVILLERAYSNEKLHSTLLVGHREAKGFTKRVLGRKHIPGGKNQQCRGWMGAGSGQIYWCSGVI